MREPLPLACMTSAAYASAAHAGARRREGRRARSGSRAGTSPRRTPTSSTSSCCGGILTLRRADRRAAAPRRAGRRLGRHRDDALRPLRACASGTACSHTRRSSSGEPASTDIQPFDVCGPLPTGVTVLEASAGTGKTFTIAALAARYVAEGTPLEQLLLVTFTRMATGELRERVRERLVSAEQGLDRALAGAPADRRGRRAARDRARTTRSQQRRERLARALADFDAATIATTHGFCQEVLGGLGVAGDVDPDATFVEDVERPARGRRRRPLRAPLPRPRHPRSSTARRPCGSRGSRSNNPRGARRARATRRRTPSRRCAAGSRSPSATSSTPQAPAWRS